MSSIFQYAYSRVKHSIPQRILQQAFSTDGDSRPYPRSTTWTDALHEQVLAMRVLTDMNVRGGGEEIRVSTETLFKSNPEPNTVIFTLDPSSIGNRAIISVLEITYMRGLNNIVSGVMGPAAYGLSPRPDSVIGATRMANALGSAEMQGNATADVIGPFTIRVRNEMRVTNISGLRLLVENDSNLANVKVPYWGHFANLVVLATKAYIYNKLRTEIGNAAMVGGMSLGIVSDVVNEYADAEEMYIEALNKWAKVAKMNDRTQYDRYLQLQATINL